jgi:hypothetical protein
MAPADSKFTQRAHQNQDWSGAVASGSRDGVHLPVGSREVDLRGIYFRTRVPGCGHGGVATIQGMKNAGDAPGTPP